jgi:hypothetical protein
MTSGCPGQIRLVSPLFLGAWAAAVAVAAVVALRSWWRTRRCPPREAWRHATTPMTVQAFALALIWRVLPMVLLPAVEPAHQLIVAFLMADMISAGGFTLSTAPAAGLVDPRGGWPVRRLADHRAERQRLPRRHQAMPRFRDVRLPGQAAAQAGPGGGDPACDCVRQHGIGRLTPGRRNRCN